MAVISAPDFEIARLFASSFYAIALMLERPPGAR
jgi:hypothetical protein